MSGLNGGMNFNARANGQLTLVVPVGWHVVLHFRNADQNMPHSAAVIPMATPVPVGAGTPAFPHAVTHRPDQGLPSDGHEDIRFLADKAGMYMIFCAVPGHGAAGMWMRLDVSATAAGASVSAGR